MGDWLPTLLEASGIDFNLTIDGLNMWKDLMEAPSNSDSSLAEDREILHMLDDIEKVTSYMKGELKYVNGSNREGEYDYVLSQRSTDIADPRDTNYEQTIKSSLVSDVLQKYDESPLTSEKIRNLRQEAAIQCQDFQGPSCNASQEECLFNIHLDPCEQNNLASNPEYFEILREMGKRVETLRQEAVPPKTGGAKYAYDPLHFDCTWTNYLEETPTDCKF